jgi:hypothetical protein
MLRLMRETTRTELAQMICKELSAPLKWTPEVFAKTSEVHFGVM